MQDGATLGVSDVMATSLATYNQDPSSRGVTVPRGSVDHDNLNPDDVVTQKDEASPGDSNTSTLPISVGAVSAENLDFNNSL